MSKHLPYPLRPSTSQSGGPFADELRAGDTTPLVFRKLQNRQNVRALILGDSIAAGPLTQDQYGVLKVLQDFIGNAGGGGYNVNQELYPTYAGGTVGATANWFRTYHSVPAGGTVELAGDARFRRFGDTIRIAWRAVVGGTSVFKIQTCSDVDTAAGTWVDVGATYDNASTVAEEEILYEDIALTEDLYRVRVLGVTGTVHVVNMEISHSEAKGCIINNHSEGGVAMELFGDLSDRVRKTFIDAVNPDVIFLMYKDGPIMEDPLNALTETLAASLTGGYPRDVVAIAPFQTLPEDSSNWNGTIDQRDEMVEWANDNRATYIDLINLFPPKAVYYNGDGVHVAGAAEEAYIAQMILDRLGWVRYPKAMRVSTPIIRTARRTAYVELPNNTDLAEDTSFRIFLDAGIWRINGRFLFSNDGTAGEGAKLQMNHTGTAVMQAINYKRWDYNASPIVFTWPHFGASYGFPFNFAGCTGFNYAYGYDVDQVDLIVYYPGFLTIKVAKEAIGGAVYFRESSFLSAEKVS